MGRWIVTVGVGKELMLMARTSDGVRFLSPGERTVVE